MTTQDEASVAGDDGSTVLNLSWWRDEAAIRGFTGNAKARWWAGVDGAVPGLERLGRGGIVAILHIIGGYVMGERYLGCLHR